MKLVVDSNVLLSFFRENPVREIIVKAGFFELELYTPKYAIEELENNKSAVMKYAGIQTEEEFRFVLSTLELFIQIVPIEFFEDFKTKAKDITPDEKDAPFFALALKLNCSIWSQEPGLKQQSEVKVLSNKEVLEKFGFI